RALAPERRAGNLLVERQPRRFRSIPTHGPYHDHASARSATWRGELRSPLWSPAKRGNDQQEAARSLILLYLIRSAPLRLRTDRAARRPAAAGGNVRWWSSPSWC